MNQNVTAQVLAEDDEDYKENPLDCDNSLRKSLKSIPSVSNINVFCEENADVELDEIKTQPIIIEEDDKSDDSEDETTEVEEEISQDTETAELHFPHQLSIIYEENESNNERRGSVVSRSSTLSDCSTTLMEEDNISVDYSADELDEENSNSVTVRLPLKFSFTRNKDNLVDTTLTVGESEFSESNSEIQKPPSPAEVESPTPEPTPPSVKSPSPPVVASNSRKSSSSPAADVSVTFRLKSKSKTPERIFTPALSIKSNSVESDPECSVSISLPKRSMSREPKFDCLKVPENIEELSENSADNKKHIDSSLFTSLDALEEIKRGMAEITNSLCSKICTLRKSALNIPSNEQRNDSYRSSSTSQIESIDTDSENDLSLSFGDYRMENVSDKQTSEKRSFHENDTSCTTEYKEMDEDIVEENVEDSVSMDNNNEDDGIDFWSQISSANKTYEDPEAPNLSKTSTHSSRYWFDEDYDENGVDGAPTDDETLDEKLSDLKEIEEMETEIEEMETEPNEVDFWQNYDETNHAKFRANNYFNVKETVKEENGHEEEENENVEIEESENISCNGHDKDPSESDENVHKQETKHEKIISAQEVEESEYETEYETDTERTEEVCVDEPFKETPMAEPQTATNLNPPLEAFDDDQASEEEWTEEEIDETDDEGPQKIAQQKIEEKLGTVDDDEVYDDKKAAHAVQEATLAKAAIDEKINKFKQSDVDDEELSCSEDESEASDDEEVVPDCRSSSSKITKGKSLVNVNSYIASGSNSRDKIPAIDEANDSEESEYSSAEEAEQEANDLSALPAISSNHSLTHSNDDCQLLTPIHTSHDDQVLLPTLTSIQSIDSKSNMTSESGISFEHNDPDSEDGYEEDSEGEAPPEDEDTVTKEGNAEDEIKINVKGKISMFERAMSEEPPERSVKDVPRVPAKYSFRHRESSEPPLQKPALTASAAVPQRAVSEVKEVEKNQKLLDLINQRKSLPPMTEKEEEVPRKSVKERISSFEASESDASEKRENFKRYGNSKKSIPLVRSIDESGEEDSGVNSDFCKQFSENETDSENFPELRKLSRYQRASTHSRLFKLLQGDEDEDEAVENETKEVAKTEPAPIPYKSKKIIHNVSVTRRQNPKAALEAETMEERRQRLCLPLSHQSSSGAESMSSSTTPSPTPGVVNEKLVNELVQSLLSQKKGRMFKNLPIEKLHAAAVKILQEDLESNGTLSSADESTIPTVDSTPAITPQEFRNNSSYTEYYDSWDNNTNGHDPDDEFSDLNLIQSKAFKNLQDQQINANKKLWSVRCPRILSSKSINKDLARLSEVRESESPEPNHSRSPSIRSLSTDPMSGENVNIQERQMAKNCNT